MDSFVDARDYSLLDRDPYTFFVLRRIVGGDCRLLLSDHESLIICYTGEPYPVWVWTADGASLDLMEEAYSLIKAHDLLGPSQRLNVKYDFAGYLMNRAAKDGIHSTISTNMFAYDCPEPKAPSVTADGWIHRCTDRDLDELTQFLAVFHQEIGIDQKSMDDYRIDAAKHIETGNMFLWRDSRGNSTASCKFAQNGRMASINLVFTRPEYRRKHYAENLVYQVTKLVHESGCIPMLYTDADYVASNACYEKIGYVLRGKLCTVMITAQAL